LNYARNYGCNAACKNYHLLQATHHPVITWGDDKNGTSQSVKEHHYANAGCNGGTKKAPVFIASAIPTEA